MDAICIKPKVDYFVKIGVGKSCATFGELLQGVLLSERSFLITFPIQEYSNARFEYSTDIPLSVNPPHKKKSLQLAHYILDYYDVPLRGLLTIDSTIPEGKGMASSSSDLVATARAITHSLSMHLPIGCLEAFMSEIEPSDGVMYDACVSYYQKEALLRSYLGLLPSIVILAVDEGGIVDTIQFNEKRKLFTTAEKYEYSILLKKMEYAIRKKDYLAIGNISTQSAILNQRLKINKYLNNFLEINEKTHGIGIAIAHSGTYIGILYHGDDPMLDAKIERAKKLLNLDGIVETTEIYRSLDVKI